MNETLTENGPNGLRTLPEWAAYISALAGDALRSKAIAANSQQFADVLRATGIEIDMLRAILLLFCRQFLATGQKIPDGGIYELRQMAFEARLHETTQMMSEKDVARLIDKSIV